MGILILDRLKDYLKITDESQDGILQNIIDGANAMAESYCHRNFDSLPLTDEVYDGTDTSELWLRRTPVTVLTAVKYGYPTTNTLDASNYTFHLSGRLYMITGLIFDIQTNWWKISYTGGYTGKTMPADLIWAVTEMAALTYKKQDAGRIGLLSKTAGGQVVESYVQDLPKNVTTILDAYKRVHFE